MQKRILWIAFALILFSGCKKDNTTNNNSSRTLRYEITGNYSGSLVASYTTATGGTANETVTTLPWAKEITYASSVTAADIAIAGNGGTVGQQVTVIVKRGGTQVSSTTTTADNAGSLSRSAPVIVF